MITEERVLDFIRSFGVDRGSEALHMIEKEAIRDDVPIIRKESGELLRILLQIKKPEKILEVGAAIGFSSVFMGENTDNNTHITTIENYPPRIERAKVNIALAGMEDKITLISGDAAEVLKELSGCGEGTVYSLYAGSNAASGPGRNFSLGQCFAGWRYF